MINENEFKNPRAVYRTMLFWGLNDLLEENELRRQINQFKEQGVGGVCLHPRGGMLTEYLSEDFFTAIEACLQEMQRLGMVAWVYDEDRFPSGNAGGKVAKANRAFSQKCITRDGQVKQTPEELRYDDTSYVDVCDPDAVDCFIRITHDEYERRFREYFGSVITAAFTDEPSFKTETGLPWAKDLDQKFKEKYGYDLFIHINDLFEDSETATKTRFDYWSLLSSLFVESFTKRIFNWCNTRGIAFTGHFWEHEFPSPLFSGSVMPQYEAMHYPGIDMLFVADQESPAQYGNDLIVKEASSVANQLGKERVMSETNGASGWGLDFAYQKRATDWQLALGINYFCQHLSLYSMTGYRKRDFPLSFLDHQPWWDEYKLLGDYIGRMSYALSQGKYAAEVLVLHPSSSTWIACGGTESQEKLGRIEASVKNLAESLNRLRIMFDLGDDVILSNHGQVAGGKLRVEKMAYKIIVVPEMYVLRREVFGLLKEFLHSGGVIVCVGETPYLLDGEKSEELTGFFNADNTSQGMVKIANEMSALSAVFDSIPVPKIILAEAEGKDISHVYGHIRRQSDDEGGSGAAQEGGSGAAQEGGSGAAQEGGSDADQTVFLCNLDMDQSYELQMRLEKPCAVTRLDTESGESSPCAIYAGSNMDYYIRFTLHPLQSTLFILHENERAEVKAEMNSPNPSEVKSTHLSDWAVTLKDFNAFNLQFCRVSLDGEPYGEIDDVLKIDDSCKDKLGIERGHIFMRQPWMYSAEEKNNTHCLKAEYKFVVSEIPDGRIMAAVELPDQFTVFINDVRVCGTGGFYKDRAFSLYDIKSHIKRGENIIRIETEVYGVLTNIESVYIVGDFKLENAALYSQQPVHVGDIVKQGYPYYAGKIEYTTEVVIDRDDKPVRLVFGTFHGVTAAVRVNGEKIRVIGWPPYEADLTGRLVTGKNKITIEISNSLQNLLGPFDPQANQHLVTPGSFYAGSHETFFPVGFDGEAMLIVEK